MVFFSPQFLFELLAEDNDEDDLMLQSSTVVLSSIVSLPLEGFSPVHKCIAIDRARQLGHQRLYCDYFASAPTYGASAF